MNPHARHPDWQPGGRKWCMVMFGAFAANASDGQPETGQSADQETMRDLMIVRFDLPQEEAEDLIAQAVTEGLLSFNDTKDPQP